MHSFLYAIFLPSLVYSANDEIWGEKKGKKNLNLFERIPTEDRWRFSLICKLSFSLEKSASQI